MRARGATRRGVSAVIAAPLSLPIAPRTLAALLAAPALEPEQVEPVRGRLSTVLGEQVTGARPEVLPRALPPPRTLKEAPVPCLRIFPLDVARSPYWMRYGGGTGTETLRLARPWFRYGGHEILAATPDATLTRRDADGLVRIVRAQGKERDALRRLSKIGFTRAGNRYDLSIPQAHRDDLTLIPDEDLDSAWLGVLLGRKCERYQWVARQQERSWA
jgi:hypothetical protein